MLLCISVRINVLLNIALNHVFQWIGLQRAFVIRCLFSTSFVLWSAVAMRRPPTEHHVRKNIEMTYFQFLDFISVFWGLASAIFFSIGVLKLTDKSIKIISSSAWESGEQVAAELAQQKVDFQFGAFFLFISFLSQFILKIFSESLEQYTFDTFLCGMVFSIIISFIPIIISVPIRIYRRKDAEKKAREYNK